MIVTVDTARKILVEQNLLPIDDLWHYSFNIGTFYEYLDYLTFEGEGLSYLIAPKKINQWAPLPIFSNQPESESLGKIVSGSGRYWICRLTSFESFLERRSNLSQNPRKHFPSKQTFEKRDSQLRGTLIISDLDISKFQSIYDRLKRESHLNGCEVVESLIKSNVGVPKSWFKMMTLTVNDTEVGVGLLIDDNKSQSLINLASVIDSNRYGLYMLTLWLRECCKLGRTSVDAGISGTYGIYKNQIFLDSQLERIPGRL